MALDVIQAPTDAEENQAPPFQGIERIFAKHGAVITILKDGRQVAMTPQDAAYRAKQLNEMDAPPWHKRRTFELVEQIIQACREAKYQQESPKDALDEAFTRTINHQMPDGSPVEEQEQSPEQQLQLLHFQLPALSLDDIQAVWKDTGLTEGQKLMLLRAENSRRGNAVMQQLSEKASAE